MRDLVTQRGPAAACASSRGCVIATPSPGRHSLARGNSPGSRERRASGLCSPRDSSAPRSIAGDAGYVGRGEITCDSTCIYDVPHRPSRPLLQGHMISQCRARMGPLEIRSVAQTSGAISRRQIHRFGVRTKYRFKPLTFAQNQTGADTKPSSRIFNRRDWQVSSFTTLARFMTSYTLSGFSRSALRIFSRSLGATRLLQSPSALNH